MFDSLRSRIYQWFRTAYIDNTSVECEDAPLASNTSGRGVGGPELCSLNIYKASGGIILEFRRNDPKKDEYDYNLHIVSDDAADIEQRMARIIQLEMMKF